MKNKKSIYILLPVVLLIWGMLIYRFFSFTNIGATTDDIVGDYSLEPLPTIKHDSIIINVNYRDPFLGKMYLPSHAGAKVSKSKKLVKKEPVHWPQVVYKGIVSDTKNKKKVFMIIVNGKANVVKENETMEHVTLVSGDRKSIMVKYEGDLTEIFIQE